MRFERLLLLALPAVAKSLSANGWMTQGNARLGLLPFLLEHALLPGETRDLFLFDDSLRACVSAATTGHIGGLLLNEDGQHFETSLVLRIDDVRADENCAWVRLSCVGRCLIDSVRRNKRHRYRVANVSPCTDSAGESEPNDHLPICALHAQVAAQRRRLWKGLVDADMYDKGTWESLSRERQRKDLLCDRRAAPRSSQPYIFAGPDKARSPFGVYESYEAFEETGVLCEHVYVGQTWEHPLALGCCYFHARDPGEIDDEENGAELEALIVKRRAVLSAEPSSASADGGLVNAIGELWGAQSEADAQLQLLSFAAAATLSPMDRAQALMVRETGQRLELARRELRSQQSLLNDLLEMPALQSEESSRQGEPGGEPC